MSSTPLLLIGGLAMPADEFTSLAKALHPLKTFCFDNLFVGRGPRFPTEPKLSIRDQAHHQWARVDEFTTERISIFGISMGGMIAAEMAALKPQRVAHLVLGATSPNLESNRAVKDDLYRRWILTGNEIELRSEIRIAFGNSTLIKRPEIFERYFFYRFDGLNLQTPKDFITQLNSIRTFDGAAAFNAISNSEILVTVVSGTEDDLFPREHVADFKKLLPVAQFIEIPESGHMLHLEAEALLAEVLRSILKP